MSAAPLSSTGTEPSPDATAGEARRRRRPWVRLALGLAATGVVVLALPMGIRWSGLRALRATLDRQRAEGLGALPADALAEAPSVDRDSQRRFVVAGNRLALADPPDVVVEAAGRQWMSGYESAIPAGVREWHDAQRALVAERDALLASGNVALHVAAGVEAPPGGFTAADVLRFGGPPHRAGLVAASWHRIAAVLDGDASSHLDALDVELRVRRAAGSFLDVLFASALLAHRDSAYLEAALRRDLSREREDAWCAEDNPFPAILAAGLRGERQLYAGALASDLVAGRTGPADLLPQADGPVGFLEIWIHGPADWADYLDRLAGWERALRDGLPLRDLGKDGGAQEGALLRAASLQTDRVAWLVVDSGTVHRSARVAVRLVRAARERGRLPADEGELRAWLGADARLLDANERGMALRYWTHGSGRVNVLPDGDSRPSWLTGESPYLGPAVNAVNDSDEDDAPTTPVSAAGARFRLPFPSPPAPASGK